MRLHYLEDTNEIFDDNPLIVVSLESSQFQGLISSDVVNCMSVCEYKMHHVVG